MAKVDVETMRNVITNVTRYKVSATWQQRVAAMSDAQVMAIYFRFLRDGIIK